jgi:hypothetical protein
VDALSTAQRLDGTDARVIARKPRPAGSGRAEASMQGTDRAAIRAFLTAEATRRFGAERAGALARDIDALAADLAEVARAAVADETEPAFFLRHGDA